jgi:hypothetical protein
MLSEEDRVWLQNLNESLWPANHKAKDSPVSVKAYRLLTHEELDQLTAILDKEVTVNEMVCTNMFGGYGMIVHAHELYPGTGAEELLYLTEGNLPPPSRFERDVEAFREKDRVSGSGSTRAWNYFSKYTHSKKNRAWLKGYKLPAPQSRGHYDY